MKPARIRPRQSRRRIVNLTRGTALHLARKRTARYEARQALLTRGELAFHSVLRMALPAEVGISLKTRLADILHCPESRWDSPHGRRIAQKHVDFVLYDYQTTAILAVIELDDRSHLQPHRRKRDRFLDASLRSAGVSLLRVRAARHYNLLDLRTGILAILSKLKDQEVTRHGRDFGP